jgi:hypothetical protein
MHSYVDKKIYSCKKWVLQGDPSSRLFDDGALMHKYLLCTGIVVVPASDPKDLFVERVIM